MDVHYPMDELKALNEPDWPQMFNVLDTDNDGYISLVEFRALLANENERRRFKLPQHAVDEILARADVDMDHRITYEEFISMVNTQSLNAEGRSLIHQLIIAAVCSVVPRSKRVRRHVDQYTCCPPPFFILTISLIQVILFVYDNVTKQALTVSSSSDTDSHKIDEMSANSYLIYNPYRRLELWRYVTYMFVHSNYVHIVTNIVIQLVVGVPLEMVHRSWRVACIYLCGVVFSALATSVFDPHVYLVGASGGVYAILSSHLADLLINWSEMELPVVRMLAFVLLAVADISVAVYNRYTAEASRVAYVAHLAGAVGGLLLGNLVLRNLRVRRWERVVWWLSLSALCVLVTAAVTVNILA